MKYKDYYSTLEVDRSASQEEIRKGYRRLARKFHPDLNPKNKQAEERFKEIQEAYAVLSDPEKRRQYDQLGRGWSPGSEFSPPPGWSYSTNRVEDLDDLFGETGGFSEFFQSLFGGDRFEQGRREKPRRPASGGEDIEAEIELSLEDLHHGATPKISLQSSEACPDCGGRGSRMMSQCGRCKGSGNLVSRRRMTVHIPAGARPGAVLRLAGKGNRKSPSGPRGDLYLKVKLKPQAKFEISGDDITSEVAISPWEAALGAKVSVRTVAGSVEVSIPPRTQAGARLRLRGQGLRKRDGSRGDQFVRVRVVFPERLSSEEEELFRKLASVSSFNPRN